MRTELSHEEERVYFKYADLALPRHTSYPIAPMWKSEYSQADHKRLLQKLKKSRKPVSLYFHVPFCEKLCFYCACNKEIRPKGTRTSEGLSSVLISYIKKEMALVHAELGEVEVKQIHFGGGTPTYLSEAEFKDVFAQIHKLFTVTRESEISIEIDPRTVDRQKLEMLFELGFNRVSLGVQEFDHKIQKAINRIQPKEMVERLLKDCREIGFNSVNFDLIYGLPYQTLETIEKTINEVARMSPDRIAFYRLAVIPDMFKWQKTFVKKDLPQKERALALNLKAIDMFQKAGYQFIGLDHFAKADEPLAVAYREKTLRRTFQGMTTGGTLDVLGFGPSAISIMDDAFAQNDKSRLQWQERLDSGFPLVKGLELNQDDKIRRALLQELYGYMEINFEQFEQEFEIDFQQYFSSELERLKELEEQGLVKVSLEKIVVQKPLGALLVRVVGSVFDGYLPKNAFKEGLQSGASKL